MGVVAFNVELATWECGRDNGDLRIGQCQTRKLAKLNLANRKGQNLAKVEKWTWVKYSSIWHSIKGDTQHPYIHELKSSYRKQQMAKLLHKNTVTWKSFTMSHDLPKTNIPGSMTRDQGFLFFAQSCCLHNCVFLWIVMSDPEDKLLLMLNKGDGHGPWTMSTRKKQGYFKQVVIDSKIQSSIHNWVIIKKICYPSKLRVPCELQH